MTPADKRVKDAKAWLAIASDTGTMILRWDVPRRILAYRTDRLGRSSGCWLLEHSAGASGEYEFVSHEELALRIVSEGWDVKRNRYVQIVEKPV